MRFDVFEQGLADPVDQARLILNLAFDLSELLETQMKRLDGGFDRQVVITLHRLVDINVHGEIFFAYGRRFFVTDLLRPRSIGSKRQPDCRYREQYKRKPCACFHGRWVLPGFVGYPRCGLPESQGCKPWCVDASRLLL